MCSKKLYIETYGCQMNTADSEVVAAVLGERGYSVTQKHEEADVILVNTCSIRDNAEKRIWSRLDLFKSYKKKRKGLLVGLIGCMAERIGEDLLENKAVDIVAGPDAYRDLPYLFDKAKEGEDAINIELTTEETYDSIIPERIGNNKISGFVSITRGCNNFCTYCIVPYTRGRERSRDPKDIINEVKALQNKGYREVTLLGQNVNSFKWQPEGERRPVRLPDLLEMVAEIDPLLRVRFSTSHPKDLSDKLLRTIAKHHNICKHIHLPVQSGNSRILKKMNRKYDREWYEKRITSIQNIIPECAITTDVFCGFCTETEEEHKDTLSLMEWAKFDASFMYKFSMRPGTYAHKNYEDDISEEIKTARLNEIISLQNRLSLESRKRDIGKTVEVLTEGISKKNSNEYFGRSSQNKIVVFPKEDLKFGDYALVEITNCTQTTLIGKIVGKPDQ
jgi:tRNA-2-methylthio-N6-dimethylallyladenosine synthase